MAINCPNCRNSIDVPDITEPMHCTCPQCHTTFRVEGRPHPLEGGNSAFVTIDVDGQPQRRFGRFRILREIGRGGFGTVYKAVHIDLDFIVALKIPRSGELATEDEKQRFYKEGRKAASLDHPAIVPTFDAGEIAGTPYIVSKFVDGTTLANFKGIRPLNCRESAQLVATVADALHYAHQHNLAHRDVKPQNLMVDRSLSPMLMDFGLAKNIQPGITVSTDGGVAGTPAYMSPEQAEGESSKIDFRTDVYSLGVVLYELLTDELPFQGRYQQVVDQIRASEPRPPRSLNGEIPVDLETICTKAMSKEPRLRYQTAAKLADDLRHWLAERPIEARPISSLGRAWRWCRRNRIVASLMAMFTISMLAGTSVSTVLYLEAAAERDATAAANAQSLERLSRIHVAESDLNATDDPMTSAGYLAEALRCDEDNPQRAQISCIRLAATLDRCPTLEQTWWHDDQVTHVTCSPDGRYVLTTSGDRTARIWDRESGSSVTLNHDDRVNHGEFSPDGGHIVTACQDGTAFVWDAATGEQVARLDHGKSAADRRNPQQVHRACIRNQCMGADLVVLTVSVDATFLWDGLTGQKIYTVPCTEALRNVCFDASGRYVAFSSSDCGVGVVLAVGKPEPSVENLPHASLVHDLAFSATGETLATACEDGAVRFWELDKRRARTRVEHPAPVRRMEFSADGRLLAIADDAGNVVVYLVRPGTAPLPQIGAAKHKQRVTELAFDPSGRHLTTVSKDKVRVWNVDTDQGALKLRATITHPLDVRHAEPIESNGSVSILTACEDGGARIWKLPPEQLVFRLPNAGHPFESVAFDHHGRRFVAAIHGSAPALVVCDVDAARVSEAWTMDDQQGDVRRHKGMITCADMSADGRFVVTGGVDNRTIVWGVAERQAVAGPFNHDQIVDLVSINHDARLVLSMNLAEENIRVWDVSSGQVFKHDGPVRQAVFSPTEPVLAIAEGRTVTFRDLESHRTLDTVLEHESVVNSCVFSPDGSRLVVCGNDGTARIWKWRNATPVGLILQHARLLHGVVYNDSGTRILTFGDQQARVWNASDGTSTGEIVLFPRTIEIGALTPDGRIACTATSGGKLYIWDVLTGEPVAPAVEHGEALLAARFIGQDRLLSVTETGSVRSIAMSTTDSDDRLYERVELLTCRRPK